MILKAGTTTNFLVKVLKLINTEKMEDSAKEATFRHIVSWIKTKLKNS